VVLRLHELSTEPQLQALDLGRLDAAFVSGGCEGGALRQRLTWGEAAVAVLPAAHPLAARGEVALAELADERFISFPRGQAPALHDRWLAACLAAGFAPRVEQEAQSWHAITALVGGELGVAVAPASVRTFATPGIACVPLAAPGLAFQASLCTRAEAPGPSLARFIAAALDEADALGLALEPGG
jgi:DNA-binding transcriptional LysR family regulator